MKGRKKAAESEDTDTYFLDACRGLPFPFKE